MAHKKNKFKFGTDFQELILQYTVTDKKGFKILPLYEDSYFELIHHSVIAYSLKKYYKKHKRIPDEPYLREFVRVMYETDNKVFNDLLPEDREQVSSTISKIYSEPVVEPDQLVSKCISYARYVKFRDELEEINIDNFDSWQGSISKLTKAISFGTDIEKDNGVYIVKGINDRVHKRDQSHIITPTPFWQINQLMNSGGIEEGNLITILSKEKFFKTGALINIAIGFMKRRMKGFYADLENGRMAIVTRIEQSAANREQSVIQSGDYDPKLVKLFRKYRRIGGELLVEKFPNLQTTTNDLQIWLDREREENGFVPDFGIVDYGLLMGSNSGKEDDFGRISDAFLDLKNLAAHNKLRGGLWTAAHTTRLGAKRTATRFEPGDIAKCIDIVKHIDMLLGLQQNEEEQEAGVIRFEVIEQRNGRQGKAYFWVDIPKQRMKEFSKAQVREFKDQSGQDDDEIKTPRKRKPKKVDL